MTPAVIYARYSSHAQRDVSIDQQADVCRAFAERQGLDVIRSYEDRAISGTTDRRPGFQQMIEDAERKDFQYVIVYALDRFARDRYDSAVYKRRLKALGVRVISATENIGTDPSGVLLESLLEGLAEYYSKELAAKIMRGKRDNAKKGLIAGGSVAYGYRRGADGRHEIVEAEAAVVREIFDRVRRGDTYADIARDLNARGIRTRSGGEWGKGSFHRMLKNDIYIGVYRFKDIILPDAVPPILDRDTFAAVHGAASSQKRHTGSIARKRSDYTYLLSGRAICAFCGAKMTGVSGTGRHGDRHGYYICRNRRRHKCEMPPVPKDKLEDEIAVAIRDFVLSDEVIEWMADTALTYQAANDSAAALDELRARLADVEKKQKNILSAIEDGFAGDAIRIRYTDLLNEEIEIRGKIEAAAKAAEDMITREEVISFLRGFKDGDIENADFRETLLSTFLAEVRVDKDMLSVRLNFTAAGELSVPFESSSFKGHTWLKGGTKRTLWLSPQGFVLEINTAAG